MSSRLTLFLLLTTLNCSAGLRGDDPERVHRITLPEYKGTLNFWAEKFANVLKVKRVAVSQMKLPIHLLTITDPTTDNSGKQVVLITSLHGGPERSGTTAILHLIEWLTGKSEQARETRRKQIILIMPINHPESFFQTDRFLNTARIDPYTGGGAAHWDLEKLEYKSRDKAPEVAAVLDVMDEWQPDVHADVHGTGLQEYPLEKLGDRTRYQGQVMFEVTGSAYSNYALRPWDWRVTEAIIRAGEQAGFPSDRFEADAQRSYHGPVMNPIADKTWRGQPNFYTAQYSYAKYHTMVSAFEVGWERSGVARLKGLLQIGNERWQNEPNEGYPIDRVKSFVGHFITSYGETAIERRRSRVELWQKQGGFTQGILYPQTDGRDTFFVATTKSAADSLTKDLDEFLSSVVQRSGVDSGAFQKFVRSGPEIILAVDKAHKVPEPGTHVANGIGFRLRLPYRAPTINNVMLNGHALKQSSQNGWHSWFANGYTQVQINLSPKISKDKDLFLITCDYTPDLVRRIGWTPPQEVVDRLANDTAAIK